MVQTLMWAMVFGLTIQSKAPDAPANLVRVYTRPESAGDEADRDARRESLKDLRAALAGKKKDLVLVQTENDADVVVEVVDRSTTIPRVVFGPAVVPGHPPSGVGMASPVRAVHLRVTLTYGADPLTFTNKTAPAESNGGWRLAADDIAKQVDKWIVDHRAEILAKRKSATEKGAGARNGAPAPNVQKYRFIPTVTVQ